MHPKPFSKLLKVIKNYEITTSPHAGFRTLKGLVRARVLKKNTLRAIELYPTFACQANCPMCSVAPYKKKAQSRKQLSLEDYESLARKAGRLGATTIIILGGEPTLYKNIVPLISLFRKHHYFIHMVSNGLQLDEELLRSLKDAGLASMFFSLESLNAVENDKLRGQGHHRKTMKNISACQQIGMEVGLAPIFFPGRVNQALEIIDYCQKKSLRASGGQISKIGKAVDLPVLSKEEIEQVRKALDQYPNFVFDWSFSYFPGLACPAGREKIGITLNGDVIPCSYNPISFGNVFEEELSLILKRMGAFSQFKKRYEGCMCSEDKFYIENYQACIANNASYPVMFSEHPRINPTKEPELYNVK